MPDLHLLGGDPERDDAEQMRLSLAWNAFLRGETDALDALDPNDAAVIDHLDLLTRASKPRNAFANQLKEQLMDASVSLPRGNAYRKDPPSPLTNSRSPGAIRSGRRWWDSSRHALGAVATIALVVISLFGGYLAISSSGNGGGEQHNGVTGFATPDKSAATPAACNNCQSYPPSDSGVEMMGNGFVNLRDLSDAQRGATKVQLQDWTIDPTVTVDQAAQAMGDVQGVAVDFVIDGAAVATVHGPTTFVKRDHPAGTSDQSIFNLASGDKVALGPGDVLSYHVGDAPAILNPLPSTRLHIKRAVIYSGNVAPVNPTSPQSQRVFVTVDGDGPLAKPLAAYGENDVTVELDYVRFSDGTELPEHRYGTLWDRALGPVDPVRAEDRGYVLWVGTPLG